MTPKEKAKELFDKYFEFVEAFSAQNQIENAKQCAMMCVVEILKNDYSERAFIYEDKKGIHYTLYSVYWGDVLIEITKL